MKSFWFRRSSSSAARPRRSERTRLTVTPLEDRATPALLQVVPYQGADGVSRFDSLQAAYNASQAGDTIQIEPGATGLTETNRTVYIYKSLTIQGDPGYGGAAGLQAAGTTTEPVNVSANNVTIKDLMLPAVAISPGVSGTVVTNNIIRGGTVSIPTGTVSGGVVQVFSGGTSFTNGGTTVTGNMFSGGSTVRLGTATSATNRAAGDVVRDNVFLNVSGTALSVTNETNVVVSGNRVVTTVDASAAGLPFPAMDFVDTSGAVTNNTIRANGPNWTGVRVADNGGGDAVPFSLIVDGNAVSASVAGIAVQRKSSANSFNVQVSNNSLAGSGTGVTLAGNGGSGNAVFGTVQINGNDLRGYTGDGNGFFAIAATNAVANTTTVEATGNIFTAGFAQKAVTVAASKGTVISTTNPQTGVASNLNAMFLALGGGPPTAAQHTALDASSSVLQAQEAVRSPQAAKAVVTQLYVTLLHRRPSGNEETGWVNVITGGGTLESVITGFLSSAEYYGKVAQDSAAPDGTWIRALYLNLLGRQGSPAEINAWLGLIRNGLSQPSVVSAFLQSAEFRGNQIRAYYGPGVSMMISAPNILKRRTPPGQPEVNAWINTGMDLFAIQASLLGSGEFTTSG